MNDASFHNNPLPIRKNLIMTIKTSISEKMKAINKKNEQNKAIYTDKLVRYSTYHQDM